MWMSHVTRIFICEGVVSHTYVCVKYVNESCHSYIHVWRSRLTHMCVTWPITYFTRKRRQPSNERVLLEKQFKLVFTGVNGSPRDWKKNENQLVWRSKHFKSDLLCELPMCVTWLKFIHTHTHTHLRTHTNTHKRTHTHTHIHTYTHTHTDRTRRRETQH